MFQAHTCLSCKEPIQGRADKKFCSDQCRSTYNNQNKKPHEEAIKKLNAQLRKNRTILKTLCPTGKATVRREVLAELGFSFRHFTSAYGASSKLYYLCYDYAFMPINERSQEHGTMIQKVLIVQQQDFMKSFDPWEYLAQT
ncbi:hypothetical protein [Ekhidna sp.]|uniref:hypothetical protein n=1 Tax=Ekhidna sp. TaxID=2608089 RepID=UPI003B510B7A